MTHQIRHQGKACSCKSYLYCIFFTLITLAIIIWKLQMYPFGDHFLRYMDADQYYGYYGYLQDTFFSNNDLKYSWSTVLGGGMLGTFAYYASSPFNLLLVFFKNNLILGTEVIAFLKIFFISCSFCALLNSCEPSHDLEKGIISASYAFIGYVAFYAWNASWLDGVGFLPLIILGLRRLLDERKKCFYVLMLALAVISNFYIGFMLCITSAVFYFAWCLDPASDCIFNFRRLRKSFLPYAASSILGVGLSMCLLLPAYMGLPANRKMDLMTLLKETHLNFNPLNFFSMFYTGSVQLKDSPNNLPVVFIGAIPFLLVLLFFLNQKIRRKEKIVAGILILVMVFSFEISIINVFWHGLSKNMWFNYRYSFVLSFLLLLIAFRSATHCPDSRKTLLLSGLVFFLLTFAVFYGGRANREEFNSLNLAGDLIMIVLGLALLFLTQERRNGRACIFQYAIYTLIVLNLSYNCIWTMSSGINWTVFNTSAREYFLQKEKMDKISQYYDDSAVTRIGNCDPWGRCEASLFTYAGVDNYASTEQAEKLQAVKRLGLEHRYVLGKYNSNAPRSTDDLLGIRYILSKREITNKSFKLLDRDQEAYYYENEDALPLFFQTGSLIDGEKEFENLFEYQNTLFKSFLTAEPIEAAVFETVEADKKKADHSRHMEIEIRDQADQTIYMQIPDQEMSMCLLRESGEDKIGYTPGQVIYNLGRTGADGRLNVILDSEQKIHAKEIILYRQREDLVSSYIAGIKAVEEPRVVKETSSHLWFETDNDQEAIYTSTVPYETAWEVCIDGKKTKTGKNAGVFLSFPVGEGRHRVDLRYHPRGLSVGIYISAFSLLLLIITEGGAWMRTRRKTHRIQN